MNQATNWLSTLFRTDVHYIVRGGFWLSTAKGAGLITSLISSVAFANLLSPDTYGSFRYVLSILALLTIPTLSGIDTALTKAIALGHDKTFYLSLKTKILWGLLGTAGCLITALYYLIQGNESFAIIFFLGGIVMPLMEAFYLYVSILNGKKAFQDTSTHLTIYRVITVIILVATITITQNLVSLFIVYFLAHTILRLISLVIVVKKYIHSDSIHKDTISFGKHLTVTGGIYEIATNIDKVFLFHFIGPATLAGYYLALMPFKHLKNFLSSINMLALPKLSIQSKESILKTLPRKLFQSYLFVIPIIISYIVAAPFIFKLLFPLYTDYILISQIFSLLLLLFPSSLLQTALTAMDCKKELYQVTVVTAISRILIMAISIPLYGLTGAVSGLLISQILYSIGLVFVFKRVKY